MAYLFGRRVICSRWVLDILQLLKGFLILLRGVNAEDALPHCSHPLHERPFCARGPSVVRGGAFALWKPLFLQMPGQQLQKAKHQSLTLEHNKEEELLHREGARIISRALLSPSKYFPLYLQQPKHISELPAPVSHAWKGTKGATWQTLPRPLFGGNLSLELKKPFLWHGIPTVALPTMT